MQPNSLRAQRLRSVAYNLDMKYQYGEEWGIMPFLRDFKLFRKGRGRKITHMLSTQDEFLESKIYIFDYQYKKGKNGRKHMQTVFFIESKKLGLPQFFMEPEQFFSRIGELLGLVKDIDFEEHPEFSQNYLLSGDDEEYIRFAMNEQFRRLFTVEKNWTLEGINYYLIFYRKGRLMRENHIRDFYHKGLEVVKTLSVKER